MHMSVFLLSLLYGQSKTVEKMLSGEERNVPDKEIPQTSPGQVYSSLEKWAL